MKNEYFQNDVIDLRILGDIGSVCIHRFQIFCAIFISAEKNHLTRGIGGDECEFDKEEFSSYGPVLIDVISIVNAIIEIT